MEIPSSINPETIEKSTLTVGVNNLGEIIFDSKVITKNQLREELKKIEEADKYNIVIAGEKDTLYKISLKSWMSSEEWVLVQLQLQHTSRISIQK